MNMKRIIAFLLSCVLLLSFAACAQDNIPENEDVPPAVEDDGVPVEKEPAADPAEKCTVTEIEPEELYEKTGIYFFAPEELEAVSYSIIGEGELKEPIAEMKFTVKDKNENPVDITYRVQKNDMINADQAQVLFGTKEFGARNSLNVSNNIATIEYDEGGEAIVYWHCVNAGRNCCVYLSSAADNETVFIYTNLLYAFVNSDIKPE